MDAEHRHELKSNELAEFMAHIPDFIRKYSNQIIGAALILVALVVIPLYKHMRSRSSLAEEAAMISKIQTARESISAAVRDTEGINPASLLVAAAEDLEEAAQTSRYADLAALALLEKSELLRAELHIRPDVSADTISANLSRARTACEQAFEKAQSPTLKGLAELGLGLCAEEAGEYGKAREIYTKIIGTPVYDGTGVVEQARRRLDSLEDNAVKVTFAKVQEPPQTETAAEPASGPESDLPSVRADEPGATESATGSPENTETAAP